MELKMVEETVDINLNEMKNALYAKSATTVR
jgi:hypothetical protein